MSVINDKIVNKLCKIISIDPIDWDAFDNVLSKIEDINSYDDRYEQTYLTEIILNGVFFENGKLMPDVIKRFISHGYNVKANNGFNGGLCLNELFWSSYDKYIVDATKVLLDAGAPIDYEIKDDEPIVLNSIGWKTSGAWGPDNDYQYANILEACYQIVKAVENNQPYDKISTYFDCIGKKLVRVDVIGNISKNTISGVEYFNQNLALWFEETPLIVTQYIEFVVNPYLIEESKNCIKNISDSFKTLIGSTLTELSFTNEILCYLNFDNGMQLLFSSTPSESNNRKGMFEISNIKTINLKNCLFDRICFLNRSRESNGAIALLKDNEAIVLYAKNSNGKYFIEAFRCSPDMVSDFNHQIKISKPESLRTFIHKGIINGIRYKIDNHYLYIKIDNYFGLDIKLSTECVSVNSKQYDLIPEEHIKFT